MTAAEFIAWRKGQKLNQADAAHLFGVDIRTVQRWEAGDSRVSKLVQNLINRIPKGNA